MDKMNDQQKQKAMSVFGAPFWPGESFEDACRGDWSILAVDDNEKGWRMSWALPPEALPAKATRFDFFKQAPDERAKDLAAFVKRAFLLLTQESKGGWDDLDLGVSLVDEDPWKLSKRRWPTSQGFKARGKPMYAWWVFSAESKRGSGFCAIG